MKRNSLSRNLCLMGMLIFLIMGVLGGCGKPELEKIEITPATTDLTVGESVTFSAKGMSTNDIASTLNRSSKTIEKQVNSIHTKLGTHSRAELVRYATERGIQSFTDEDWTAIVEGAKVLRRERRAGVLAN